mgnify:CR=1 FL=1
MIKEKIKVAFTSVLAAIVITAGKLIVGILTGSLGILSEALHSGLDLIAAIITLFSVKISDKPADRNHHFGHGKIENLSAFIEALLLLATCAWIIYESINRLLSGNFIIEVTIWSYIVVIASIIIDFWRSRALMKTAKKYNSQALEADALHFSTDILSSSVVLLGLIFANYGIHWADSVAALGVALIVIKVSYNLSKRAVLVLLDSAPQDIYDVVNHTLDNMTEIKKVNLVRIRNSGADYFIDITAEVDKDLPFVNTHKISDKIEDAIKSKVDRSDVTVHLEPHL